MYNYPEKSPEGKWKDLGNDFSELDMLLIPDETLSFPLDTITNTKNRALKQ